MANKGASKATERQAAEAQLDVERTIARANAILAGSPLLFDEDEMRDALKAFVEYKRMSDHFVGYVKDYLDFHRVETLQGEPHCRSCKLSFSTDWKYAVHQMSREHFIRAHVTSLAAMDEVRAHLQAYPMAPELWRADSVGAILDGYRFNGLPMRPSLEG